MEAIELNRRSTVYEVELRNKTCKIGKWSRLEKENVEV